MSEITFSCKKFIFNFLVFLLAAPCFAQLSNFTLTVGKTDETCAGNGSLTFNVSGIPDGASVAYSLYLHPNLAEPFVTLSGNSYGGLSAGNYRVVATVSLGGASATQFADIQIVSSIVQLQYALAGTPAICGNNGTITVNLLQGTAVAYEIISGPVTAPLQSSNVFTGLAAGLYEVRVFDACGEGVVQAHTLFTAQAGMNLNLQTPVAMDCETAQVSLNIDDISTADIAYPLTVQLTVYPNSGPPIVFNQTITSGSVFGAIYNEVIPISSGDLFSYTIVVTDSCGNQQTASSAITASIVNPVITPFNPNCAGSGISISNVVELVLDSAPAGYPDTPPFDYTDQISDNSIIFPSVPLGVYHFTAIGLCGQEYPLQIDVQPIIPPVPSINVFEGCEIGKGTFYMGGQPSELTLIAAPAEYEGELPQDVSGFIDTENGGWVMSGLPPGTYSFNVLDGCGNPYVKSATIIGYNESTTAEVFEHCGSFDLLVNHVSNASGGTTLWLQQWNETLGKWVHPVSGVPYTEGTPPGPANSRQISNNVINYNLPFCGKFRVMTSFAGFVSGVAMITSCYNVVYEFELSCLPEIDQIYSFSCNSGSFDVIVEAHGIAPLTYRITMANGGPMVIENGTSNVFSGLAPGSYNFQVEDACHNIVNKLFDITEPLAFSVTGMDICLGESGQLSVPSFPYLNYQWYAASDPSNILSTTAVLAFTDFQVSDAGEYNVRIWHTNPLSCLDMTLSYTIPSPLIPNPGTATAQTFCGTPEVELFSLLTPPFDAGGTWTTDAPGSITANTWSSDGAITGTYTFTYTVGGTCNSASTTSTVTFNFQPSVPLIDGELQLCEGETALLTVDDAPGTVVNWTGPNGFMHTGSTLEIESVTPDMTGVYTATAVAGSCQSQASVTLEVTPAPFFTIDQYCDGNIPMIRVSSPLEMPGEAIYTFNWTGPNGFSATGNPIAIAGQPAGDYNLEVVAGGCVYNFPFTVTQTVCSIPAGVSPNSDGANDTFNLTGLGVKHLKIFNRYGMTVYEQTDYLDQWKGQDYNGNMLPSATYYYLVKLETGESRTGWVYLMY